LTALAPERWDETLPHSQLRPQPTGLHMGRETKVCIAGLTEQSFEYM